MNSRSSHPHFYERARDVNASQGLAPGFPQQFSYVENARKTKATKEKINIHENSDVAILQGDVRYPSVGQYRSMVEDIPWDRTYEEKNQAHLAAFGLGSILVGVLTSGFI